MYHHVYSMCYLCIWSILIKLNSDHSDFAKHRTKNIYPLTTEKVFLSWSVVFGCQNFFLILELIHMHKKEP